MIPFHILSIFILQLFQFIPNACAQGSDPGQPLDICDILDPNNDHTQVTPLTINSELPSQTSSCVKSFNLPISSPDLTQAFILFEIKTVAQETYYKPMLMARKNKKPQINFENQERIIQTDKFDLNAFNYKKTYHYITFKPGELALNDNIFFSVYYVPNENSQVSHSLEFSVNVIATPDFVCPQDCSKQGDCDKNQQKCLCQKGYFDVDCSVQALDAASEDFQGGPIAPQAFAFFYYDIRFSDDLKFIFNKGEGELDIAMSFNLPDNYYLPNFDGRLISERLINAAKESYYIFSTESLRFHIGSTLLISALNSASNEITFQAKINDYGDPPADRTTLMSILIGLSGFLVISWGLITILKYKAYLAEFLRQIPAIPSQELRDLLSKEDIDRYFPKMKFEDHKSSFPQNTCSICIEEFKDDSQCRQLYCEHIYHALCIENWLNQQINCPNCKKEMTKAAIEEYMASPKLLREEEEDDRKADGEVNHGSIKLRIRPLNDFEEEKEEEKGSLNEIDRKKRNDNPNRPSLNAFAENIGASTAIERKGSSQKNTPKYLDIKPSFPGHRKEGVVLSKKNTIELEDQGTYERPDINESSTHIGLKLAQEQSYNTGDKNPLQRKSMS